MRDEGSAPVEFLAVGVLLLVPVAYLVLTLGRIQAATFAAESGAREAARVLAGAGGQDRAELAVALAVGDQDLPARGASLTVDCSADPCRTPEAEIAATVRIDVALPLVPAVLGDVVPLQVPVTVTRVAVVDRFGR
ncbi:pilus assembly protein [Kineococcus sp. SYSU DK003]|uniref:pilus assembly protein n=1 Tax=Kineococcus sp. SYSU DK003 TaxID=3383124 RepID=UPI003D7ED4DE